MASNGAIAIAGKGEKRESGLQLADEQGRTALERKLKVFLSSTAQDLTEFRKAVHTRLVSSPLFECIRQEDFFAQPHPPVTVCREQVHRADLFVGLIGMRRGWEPPDDPTRRSITEMEYDWAKDVAPRFMHVTATNFPVPGDLRESEEEHQRLVAFRKRVMTELTVSQDGFASPAALANLILDRLTDHVLKGDLIERIRPRPARSSDDVLKLSEAFAEQFNRLMDERSQERSVILRLANRLEPSVALTFDRAIALLEDAVKITLDVRTSGHRSDKADDFLAKQDALFRQQIVRLLDERGAFKVAEQGGLERTIVLALANRLRPDEAMDFDGAIAELENAIAIALDVIARGRRSSNEDEFVAEVLKTVAIHTQAGENERAGKALDDALDELHVREVEQRETLKRSKLTLLQAGLEQNILNRDAVAAARRVQQSVALEHNEAAARFDALCERWGEFYVEGREKGVNISLQTAIEIARLAIDAAQGVNERGIALSNLGNALATLGERESGGTTRLEAAVTAYREALKEWTRERAPLDWAATQNNLGVALRILGERESGTARLDEAVSAYREALKERTRERAPLDWAMTQNNLGNALQTLGERESGTARLDEAVTAYREALKEYTRERLPLQWATTQNNLGNALQTLGERESGTARLDEAVTAFREALKERTRERVPLDWASTQNNLGVALRTLGERHGDVARLEQAIAAYGEALKERTREHLPLQWAMSTGNQGVALIQLADRRDDAEMATAAVNQIEQAFVVMRDAGHVPFTQYYEARLPEARAIRDRLSKA